MIKTWKAQEQMDQLDKVLALVDSSQEGEALGALRMARRILNKKGLSFNALARVAAEGTTLADTGSFFSGAQVQLEAKIEQMQDDLSAHVEQNQNLTMQIDFWRKRALELEQMLSLSQAETARWKAMARETAERLWDLGQMACAEVALRETTATVAADEPVTEEATMPSNVEKLKVVGR